VRVSADTQYYRFFNLEASPFGELPDAKFFFDSPSHTDALTRLTHFLSEGKGFALLTGEVGTGKTMMSRILVRLFDTDSATALIFFPKLDEISLLRSICEEFEIPEKEGPPSLKKYLDSLNEFVLESSARGRRCILIIDEAQSLPPQSLETIRLLSNLETEKKKLLQIVLLGQPELSAALAAPGLRQLSQRISLKVSLRPLTFEETERYIRHRLQIAGTANLVRFDPKAIRLIHQLSEGLPRRINQHCETLLQAAFQKRIRLIDQQLARATLAPQSGFSISRLFSKNPGVSL
jgi:general secretion pathway protein A